MQGQQIRFFVVKKLPFDRLPESYMNVTSCRSLTDRRALHRFRPVQFALLALFCLTACKTPPTRLPGRIISGAELERVQKIYSFYDKVEEQELLELKEKIKTACNIEQAGKLLFGPHPLYFQGKGTFDRPVGTVCSWNFKKELIHYGEYDDEGALRGVSSWWYSSLLRSAERTFPDRGMLVTRNWRLVRMNFKWSSFLKEVHIKYLKENRTVTLLFNRADTLRLKRQEFLGVNLERGTFQGIQYDSHPGPGRPVCVKYGADGMSEIVQGECPYPQDIIEGGNRL